MDEKEANEIELEIKKDRAKIVHNLISSLENYTDEIKASNDTLMKARAKEFTRENQYTFPGWVINVLSEQMIIINSLHQLLANIGADEDETNE